MRLTRRGFALCTLLMHALLVHAEQAERPIHIDEMAFNNQPVRDILLALGRATGTSIVPDETVQGTASYYFSQTTLDAALKAFLPRFRLYSWRDGAVRFVSRIRVESDGALISVDAEGVAPRTLIERIAAAGGHAVAFRSIPAGPVSLHLRKGSVDSALRLVVENLPQHRLVESADGYSIIESARTTAEKPPLQFSAEQEGYRLLIREAPLSESVRTVFEHANMGYIWLLESDPIVRQLSIAMPDMEGLIAALLHAGGARLSELPGMEGVRAIVSRESVTGRHETRSVTVHRLSHSSTEELIERLPAELVSEGRLLPTQDDSTLVVYAEPRRSAAIRRVITALDRAPRAVTRRFQLQHIEAAAALRALPPELQSLFVTVLENENALVAVAGSERIGRLERYLATIDSAPAVRTVQLYHLRADAVVAHLPPGIDRDSVTPSADPYTLFVRAPKARFRELERLIRKIDSAPAQLRFHLLIVEHYSSDSVRWSSSFDVGPTQPGVRNIVRGAFGELLSLGLDVISLFGYRFAARLSSDIGENRARILADTVLRALPDEPARFEHTSTYRYRDPVLQPDGGETVGVVTREIVSGITLELTGRIAHDDSVRVAIDASLSKRGADLTSESGNPPPTTEKRLRTSVRLKPGEPVALGGLSRVDDSSTSRKTPILGELPLFGWLFRHATRSNEDARTVIYLVSSIDRRQSTETARSRIKRYFDSLLREELQQ